MKLITISVPAYNEQESITTLYETIVNVMDSIKDKYTFELLFINDGSKDKTLEIVKQLHKEDNRVGFCRSFKKLRERNSNGCWI